MTVESSTPISSQPPASRASIRRLPPLLVNQIAAGEVVERPASVVKELVENSLDAGASRVRLEIEQGGIELIRISDDGCGIPAAELPLAIAPHATSKIHTPQDLDRIGTLGFRGEALASIASVARLEIRSRPADAAAAAIIEIEGGDERPVRPAAGPVGTAIAVRNLFFNTPARRKFLRTPQTEQQRCLDALRDLAIGHPGRGFVAVVDGRTVLDLPPGQSPRERALAILGPELKDQLLEVSADRFDDARGVALWGLAGRPEIARATAQAQHVVLNGRVVRDKTIAHAIKEAYRGLIEPGRYPTAVLMIEMDPSAVDVNVHPAKTEVRFRDSGVVHGVVLRAIRDALHAADLTPTTSSVLPSFAGPRAILPTSGGGAVQTRPAGVEAFVERFRSPPPSIAHSPIDFTAMRRELDPIADATAPAALSSASPEVQAPTWPQPVPASRVLQVHNSYLLTQDEHGVVIVDQHALHERVMFEQLIARVQAAPLETQRLLMPAVVPASPAQIESLPALTPLLAKIGVEAEPLGPTQLAVHAFPTFLFDRGVDPVEFMTDLFERADAEGFAPGGEQALHEVLDMMACKAAVKAGDKMSEAELTELLRLRDAVERSSNCPHGRPTTVRLTIRELERLFKRS
jgi:DNA mismatch repair protein MutL